MSELSRFKAGDVLVADMTDPDWEPIMKKASAIITNREGRTCHAAIVSRAWRPMPRWNGERRPKSSGMDSPLPFRAEGDDGFVYDGNLPFSLRRKPTGNP